MIRPEVEKLLFRMDACFPGPQLSEVERQARIEEWMDSAVALFAWDDVARLAWRRWKDSEHRRPTPAAFAEACRVQLRERADDRRVLPEPPMTDEQREQALRFVRLARQAIKTERQ